MKNVVSFFPCLAIVSFSVSTVTAGIFDWKLMIWPALLSVLAWACLVEDATCGLRLANPAQADASRETRAASEIDVDWEDESGIHCRHDRLVRCKERHERSV